MRRRSAFGGFMSCIALLLLVTANGDDAKKPKPLVAPFTQAQAEKACSEWARHLNIPERLEIELDKKVKLPIVLIPPGKFRMGSSKAEREYVRDQFKIDVKGEAEREVTIS